MNTGHPTPALRSAPDFELQTIDGLTVEVQRHHGQTWIAATRGDWHRLMPLAEFARDRTQVAARLRNEAFAAAFGALAALATRGWRRLLEAVRRPPSVGCAARQRTA